MAKIMCTCFISSFKTYKYIHTYIYIYAYTYTYTYITCQFPIYFPCLGRDFGWKREYFLPFFIFFLSSLEANFQSSINAYLLLYFLLAYKVKSCWLIKIIFPPFFLAIWPATTLGVGPTLLHLDGLVTF